MLTKWVFFVQVDLLITERKEAQQAAQSDESSKRQKEADNNAYLSLMPLALPAPPMGNTNDFSGIPFPNRFDTSIIHLSCHTHLMPIMLEIEVRVNIYQQCRISCKLETAVEISICC